MCSNSGYLPSWNGNFCMILISPHKYHFCLNASTPYLRNHPSKTSLKPDARPSEAEAHSAISHWKHIAACGAGTVPSGSSQSQTMPSRSAPGSQEVRVTLSDNKITSSLTTFTTGKPYHFVVTNTGNVAYQFVMVPMGMGLGRMSTDEMHRVALFMYDSVAPGETRTFNYTFPSSTAGPRFKFACGTQGHTDS